MVKNKSGVIKRPPIPYALLRQLQDQSKSVLVKNFHGVNWWQQMNVFPAFVIFYDPKDFPGKYAIRLFDGQSPTRLLCIKQTLQEARAAIPNMFYRVDRKAEDDPKIVETWL